MPKKIGPVTSILTLLDPAWETNGYQHVIERLMGFIPPEETADKSFQLSLLKNRAVILFHEDDERRQAIDLINAVKQEKSMLLYNSEACQLYTLVRDTAKIPGDIAEVGVFQGASAKLICEAKSERRLLLFDTFAGLPEVTERDQGFETGQFGALLPEVRKYLAGYSGVEFHPGLFPSSAAPVSDRRFSLVHLDVDLYESTVSCLNFFYPRMNPGGAILSHDYPAAAGVTQAINDFFAPLPEAVIRLSGRQCLIIKH
ncbi:MAG: macrocin O-methyltransferase [Candidatus Wallbacteria bacterium]|nr:macrocin O-methyltransferase [Candidatus Wallbacteria bacterium]